MKIKNHRLPLAPGPGAVLFIGVVASQGFDMPAIYSSVMIDSKSGIKPTLDSSIF